MIKIVYQNNTSEDAFDITTLVSAVKWTTKRIATPASLELTAVKIKDVVWSCGGIIALKNGEKGLFYGYVFKITLTEKDTVSIMAYDQIRYLKNKDTYVFTNQRADQITKAIAEDFKLRIGQLANTGYAIPSLIEDNQTLLDIITKALEKTIVATGNMFFFWDDYGSLRINNVTEHRLDLLIGDSSLAGSYSYAQSIDSDTYNKIKLVRNNKESGKRDLYVYQDSDNIRLWGILQDFQVVDENMNAGQIKQLGENRLELYNRPKRTFDISALSDLSVRGGCILFIRISDIGKNQFFLVEESSHDLIKGTMSLKLKAV
jgi:hypothetical protein